MDYICYQNRTQYCTKLPIVLCIYTLVLSCTQSFAQKSPLFACDTVKTPNLSSFKFCNASIAAADRVEDLVRRLSLDEKVGLLGDAAKGVPRLGIPDYEWWGEALHGVANSPSVTFEGAVRGATSFPQVLLTAASFNVTLFEAIGKVVSTEARAMHNMGLAGLTFWSPNVNIVRDPRWGRGQETPGEDPFLTSTYSTAYVRGLQKREDDDKEKLKVAACCKHYTAYDIDNWKGVDRYHFNAIVTKQDLEDTYNAPFKSCVVEGNVASVMCSYNQVNGKPTCADKELLEGVVRGQWKLNGYISTDCDSIEKLFDAQNYTKTPEEAVAMALLAGVDLNCGEYLKKFTANAVRIGLVEETVVDRAISNNFRMLMRLGFFDGDPRGQFYGQLGSKDVCTAQHQELAREAARQGIVLLKNLESTLPLSPTAVKSLAVIGPNANATDTMLGNYAGSPCRFTTVLQGLSAIVPTVTYTPGCQVSCTDAQVNQAKSLAASADATILIMGDDLSFEQEFLDRVNLILPGQQNIFITAVADSSKGPTILVIMSGGGLDVQFAKDDAKIASILWAGYPGEAGGASVAEIIFGYYNPGGKLPMSWYPQSYAETMPMTNMNMRPDPSTGYLGRTYRFHTGPTVFDFGYGLSYSVFSYHLVQPANNNVFVSTKCGLTFPLRLRLKNEGRMGGAETVMLFTSPPAVHGAPRKQLIDYEKVFLEAGMEKEIAFEVNVCNDLSIVDELGKRIVPVGKNLLQVGTLRFYVNVSQGI